MNIGYNTSSTGISAQLYQPTASAVPASHPPSMIQSQAPIIKVPTLQMPTPSAPSFPRHDASETILSNRADLVKPSSFFVPTSSSTAPAQPISSSLQTGAAPHPPLDMQRSFGAPLLQPFPPPTPPPSLTPNSTPTPSYIPLTRQKVREALVTLVQDNQFIDMVYQALQRANQS
ncbi:hypothetical protein Leryth_017566 [Lithospermum erythrorhizon]|nr:hypothetical protein Leryth_017566 [Lithospermum erythrorhizon]